ncbi:AMP-binding protein [Akkermansiaceae bacterium]|nr:AMP-binding protein [Akkermansiaceae bacterium]
MRVEELRGSDFWKSNAPLLMERNEALEDWLSTRVDLNRHVLFRTSGSSGVQKWIALSKDALAWSAERVVEHLSMTSADVCALALPTHHVGGFGMVARCEVSGARLVEFEGRWSAQGFTELCLLEKVTITSLVPTQVDDLVSEQIAAPASLRSIVVGGGSLHPKLAQKARGLGWPVVPSYGMTETGSQIATGENLPLIKGWDATVRDERLMVKGEGLLSGIVTHEGGSFEFHDPKDDGWYLTSDLASLSGRNLTVRGRADRRVKILGELVDLVALEDFWAEKTGGEVAIIGSSDERRGLHLILFYTGDESPIRDLNNDLPGPERLFKWKKLQELPRSPLGKIDRLNLREIHLD